MKFIKIKDNNKTYIINTRNVVSFEPATKFNCNSECQIELLNYTIIRTTLGQTFQTEKLIEDVVRELEKFENINIISL